MKNRKNVLEIGNQSEILYLNPNNILCIEASGNYCNIYLVDGEELESVGFQKGEVARMIDEQLPHNLASKFIQVGPAISSILSTYSVLMFRGNS